MTSVTQAKPEVNTYRADDRHQRDPDPIAWAAEELPLPPFPPADPTPQPETELARIMQLTRQMGDRLHRTEWLRLAVASPDHALRLAAQAADQEERLEFLRAMVGTLADADVAEVQQIQERFRALGLSKRDFAALLREAKAGRAADRATLAPQQLPEPLRLVPAGRPGDPPDGPTPPVTADESLPLAAPALIARCLKGQEYGDAELLAAIYRDRLVYDHPAKSWHTWAGHTWRADDNGLALRLVAGQVASQYLHEHAEARKRAEAEPNLLKQAPIAAYAEQLLERANKLRSLTRCKHVLEFAASLLPATAAWDAKPDLLAVANGVLNLTDGTLRPGNPGDYLRTAAPTEWRGLDVPAARWERFLAEILAQDKADDTEALVGFLHRLLGYAVTGRATEHVLPICWATTVATAKTPCSRR